ncbi:MAG: efflux RND transporter permease subunit, partial [Alphaproteobacteria bacterium]|nr:efflux RND transporter permease subunit [Alphaproteobacteria bacterium]
MKFTDIFVNRPVLASVLSLLILLIGARSVGLLELREYPETKTTVVTVTTAYPGADSQLVQSFITEPLQRAVSEARGIDYVTSTSTQGLSVIEIHMELNYDPNAAIAEIQAKVASQRNILPEDAKDPVIDSTTGSSFALMYLAYFSAEMNPAQITDYLLRTVIPQIQAVPGVAKAEIMGNQSFAMRVWLDPKRMAALNVSPLDVEEALRRNNYQAGIGETEADYVSINLSADTDIGDEEA